MSNAVLAFAKYAAVTEDDALAWVAQQRVTFAQLIAAGITKAEIGEHVGRDGTCWIFADLAAAVLVDAETRATIIDPMRLPNRPVCRTLVRDGDLVVAPLSRLRFVMTGSRDENGMQWSRPEVRRGVRRPGTHLAAFSSVAMRLGIPPSSAWRCTHLNAVASVRLGS